jgi:hypothetical protein
MKIPENAARPIIVSSSRKRGKPIIEDPDAEWARRKKVMTYNEEDDEGELVLRRLWTRKSAATGTVAALGKISYEDMKITELRELCHARGLTTRGKKNELVKRLTKYDVEKVEKDGLAEDVLEMQEGGGILR